MMNKIQLLFQRLSRNKHFNYGLPFLTFIVVGAVGLREFTNIRYEFSSGKFLSPEEMALFGIEMKKPGEVTLETEYDKIKKINIEGWENKRIPRPWDENAS